MALTATTTPFKTLICNIDFVCLLNWQITRFLILIYVDWKQLFKKLTRGTPFDYAQRNFISLC